ncbi:MAG TPA: hypothetical protein VLG50_07600 [Candidatus Saccharimonadales bacterium]|nr:hypothetical protein [Candidatus Saccharimonadales bacterium]
MEHFDINKTKDGDKFLLLGTRAEDFMIGGHISKHWKNIKVYNYPLSYNDELSKRYENGNINFGLNHIRKDGTIYITLGGNDINEKNLQESDYNTYDYILIAKYDGGLLPLAPFIPVIFYCK